jgi:hypothetical protein
MKHNRYVLAVCTCMLIVVGMYVATFFPIFGLNLSNDTAVWGQFGDYMGGALNPILSFVSVVLLIRSVSLQNDANVDLRNELKNNEQTERLRSFSSLFFNMIESQKSLLDDLSIYPEDGSGLPIKTRVAAIIYVEDEVEWWRANGASDNDISQLLSDLDAQDQFFSILRTFYITVKMIMEKLSDANGFSESDRRDQILTLINFTDFSQIRLILICIQFFKVPAASYLKNNEEFISALKSVKLSVEMY